MKFTVLLAIEIWMSGSCFRYSDGFTTKTFATENRSMIPMVSSVWVKTSREQHIGKDNPPVKIEIFSFFVP